MCAVLSTQSVARRYLSRVPEMLTEGQQVALADACAFVHQSMEAMTARFTLEMRRHVYVTPKLYLDLIVSYLSLLSSKRHELSMLRQRCVAGVTKLEDSNAIVARLKVWARCAAVPQLCMW